MLNSLSHLEGTHVTGNDGDLGHVAQAMLDDGDWIMRFLVIETGHWLQGRRVLIPPCLVMQPLSHEKYLHIDISQNLVRSSPGVDAMSPVSRQQERALLRHYQVGEYWSVAGSDPDSDWAALQHDEARPIRSTGPVDLHLHGTREICGYEILAGPESLGTVKDLVFDDTSWMLRYVIADTSTWWQGGRRVLVGMQWVDAIDTLQKQVHVAMTRAQVKAGPAFEDVASIEHDWETRWQKSH